MNERYGSMCHQAGLEDEGPGIPYPDKAKKGIPNRVIQENMGSASNATPARTAALRCKARGSGAGDEERRRFPQYLSVREEAALGRHRDAGFDLVLRNGRVAVPEGVVAADIAISEGRIAAIGPALGRGRKSSTRRRLILPGGVDAHCHMDQQPWEGRETADDFRTGTLSALCGGTTTVIPFAMQMRGQSLRAIVEDYHARARPKAHVDYAFHLIVGDPTPEVLGESCRR